MSGLPSWMVEAEAPAVPAAGAEATVEMRVAGREVLAEGVIALELCPQDGGSCPDGYDLVGGCCVMTPGWSCVARPGGCGATVTCACAMATLCTGGQTCTTPRENEIDCTLLAP